jgi:hypothetical protein
MGGLVAVNKGSVDEPRFVVLEYNPGQAVNSKPLALVGKGIMYDTGGLNIKPDNYMQEMKSDMAGAATMASVLFAAAANRLPVHIVAFLPLTDIRPGFVDTALLSGMPNYPMLLKPEKVARDIVRAIEHHKHIRIIDWRYRILTALWRRVPRFIWRRLKLVKYE